ncbi:MAG TPA: HAD family hydrolase, partial [Candidatus Eisenbacteria bacterium]|nr:HAD family hydrolase [Candidatus Eisenbacteria bacterium]
ELSRWSPLRHLAWHSLPALALIEPAAADAARAGRHGVALERFGLWSDGPPAPAPDVAHADTEILERACERALARAGGGASRAAVFVDRDGTLVVERGRPAEPEDLELLPGIPEAIRLLRAAGHPVVVISNQSWIGRGLATPARVHFGMARLRVLLRAHGVELDAIHFCPHRPDEGCDCRKPGTALLRRAADDLQLALARSAMVGDKRLDVATGQAAGGAGVLVRTGYGREEEARIGGPDFPRPPERVCDDLGAAAAWFLAREEGRTAV